MNDLFETIERNAPVEVFHDNTEQLAAHELELERRYDIEAALREALTKGLSIASLKILCAETGVSYDEVTGG